MSSTRVIVYIMSTLILFLPQAGCGDGRAVPCKDDNQRIVGGQLFSGLPAVGAVLNYGYLHCSGTLVEPRKVLTAGHCVSGTTASNLSFMIGPSLNSAQAVLKAVDAYHHPNYNASAITNDIGVVILAQDASVPPMGVVTAMDSSWVGTKLFFVGYGNTSSYGGSGTKRAVWMPITQVGATTFSYGGGGRNTCNGDSGGPAFFEDANGTFLVAGVTSYGDLYCNSYGVDTRVDAYLDWLDIATASDPPIQDNCNGETDKGRCDGDTLIWCENNQVSTLDCAASGKTCMPDPQTQFNTCVEPDNPPPDNPPPDDPPPDDPCDVGDCRGPVSATCTQCDLSIMDCTGQAGVFTCVPKSDTCTYTKGTLYRQCDCTGWQFCLSDNTWSTDCEPKPSIFGCI